MSNLYGMLSAFRVIFHQLEKQSTWIFSRSLRRIKSAWKYLVFLLKNLVLYLGFVDKKFLYVFDLQNSSWTKLYPHSFVTPTSWDGIMLLNFLVWQKSTYLASYTSPHRIQCRKKKCTYLATQKNFPISGKKASRPHIKYPLVNQFLPKGWSKSI